MGLRCDFFAKLGLIKMIDDVLKLSVSQTGAEQWTTWFSHDAVC